MSGVFQVILMLTLGIVTMGTAKPLFVEDYLKQRPDLIRKVDNAQQHTQWNNPMAARKPRPATSRSTSGNQKVEFEGCDLLFADRTTIMKQQRDGSFSPVVTGLNNAVAMDSIRVAGGSLLWSDVSDNRIYQSSLDGSNITVLVESGIETPDGIAWDWLYRRLYWTDADLHNVVMLDTVNEERKVLFQNGDQSKPRAIALDSDARYMYWTDWGTPATIERALMDGTSRVVLHNTNLVWPNAMTIDLATQTLYWMDGSLDRLESSKTDGSERTLLSTLQIYHPFAITFHQGDLYWSDWTLEAILMTSLSDLSKVVVVGNFTEDPMGVISVCSGIEAKETCGVVGGCVNGGSCKLSRCECPEGFGGVRCEKSLLGFNHLPAV